MARGTYFSTYTTWQRLHKNFVYAVKQLEYFTSGRHLVHPNRDFRP